MNVRTAPKGPLAGRVAWITGGGGGLGRATALALARAGCDIAILDRSIGSSDETMRLVEALGRRAVAGAADVSDRLAVEAALAAVVATLGPVAILVNAAGIAEASPILPPDDGLFDRTMATNVRGPWVVATACVPGMRRAAFGRIINVASISALEGSRYTAAYVTSKHALLGLTRAMALDLARDAITVNAVCPGFLDSPMTDRTLERIIATTGRTRAQALADVLATARQSRLLSPDDVAARIVMLALDPTTTGAAIEIRG